ncbi:hypothetical protein GOP47_0011747 [Adiantum capillus-veneris]|uniref:Uncharacterized protein n=1 Tax=Adiantum capillus-veneris TaxID=13818 RepID=A0A9D4ZFP0_ADICA|nr:hypothetical protein GOP47_0011747 [Adiantum capillus-veneris]
MAGAFGGWRHRASQFYFLIILFSFPIFSIPCQKGTCSSPVEVVAAHLLSNGGDQSIAKALLYPGSVFRKLEGIVADNEPFAFPSWNTLLKDLRMMVGNKNEESSVAKMAVIAGSYLCVIGAVFAIFGLMQVSACGMSALLWYIYTMGGKDGDVFALPMFALAMFCAIGGLLNLEGLLKREAIVGKEKQT